MDFQEQLEQKFLDEFEPFRSILKHYTCPDSCKALCCRECDIEFGKLEYKTIFNHKQKARKILETKTKCVRQSCSAGFDLVGYRFTEKPCPLLKNHRCSIQSVKPITCVLYPFALAKHPTDKNLIALEPCPMGVQVMADYMLFKFLAINSATDMTDSEKQSMADWDLELFKRSVATVGNMATDGKVLDLYIHRQVIGMFAEFIEDNSESDRLHDRIEFGIEEIKNRALGKE